MRKLLAVVFTALIMAVSVSISWGNEPLLDGGTWEGGTWEGIDLGGTWQ